MRSPTLEEMQTWSLDEIKTNISAYLPEGTVFKCAWSDGQGQWRGWFERADEVVWDQWGLDQRLLLLDAFGWCWMQRQPPRHPDSPWAARQGRVPMEAVRGRAFDGREPEDLDPKEVLSVYEAHRKKPF